MEDEDDFQSSPPPSPPVKVSAAPPSQPHANGRITVTAQPVTVAAAPQHKLTLALPIQQHKGAGVRGGGGSGSSGGGGGREDCWSEGATATLIDAWADRYVELSRGNLKHQHWQEVADIVSSRDDYTKPPKTDVQCKNRIDTLKKKYKLEKSRISSNWIFFRRLDDLIGPNNHHHHHKATAAVSSSTQIRALPALSAAGNHLNASKHAVGIPVGVRSFHHSQQPQQRKNHGQFQNQRLSSVSSKSAVAAAAAAAAAPLSPESSDSFLPEKAKANGKKRRFGTRDPPPLPPVSAVGRKETGGGEGLMELTRAVLNFGEVYERVESSKLQQVVEMEKQRMGFAKELELQRMQFFMKTQMELTQLKHHHHHHHHVRASAGGNNNNSLNNRNNNTG